MESMENIVTFPTERDGWIKTVLIGGILTFLGVFLLPLFFVYGYIISVIKSSLDGDATPPAFTDWGELFVDGLKGWIVGLIYLFIPLVVGAVTVGGAVMAMVTSGSAELAAGGMLIGFTVTAILALIFGYAAVAAIVNFARMDRMGAAFDFGTLKRVLFARDYAVAWLLSIVVMFVAGLVASIPIIGWLLGPFASFYALIVAGKLWADGFAAALEETDAVSDVRSEEPAV